MSGSQEVHTAIRMAAAAVERQDYKTAFRLLQAIYQTGGAPPAEGLSLYGLCVAVVEKKTKAGIEHCNRAIERESYDSRHRVNLIKLYLAIGSRRKAVEVLERGLASTPDDDALIAMRDRMGYRHHNPIPFLDRDNPLNQLLGRKRRKTA
jgi:hypothetical protein